MWQLSVLIVAQGYTGLTDTVAQNGPFLLDRPLSLCAALSPNFSYMFNLTFFLELKTFRIFNNMALIS